jgi:hypothetical protein
VAPAASGERARSIYLVPLGLTVAALASLALRGKGRAGAAFTLLALTPLPWAADVLAGGLIETKTSVN